MVMTNFIILKKEREVIKMKKELSFEYMEDMLVRMAHHSTAIEGNTMK